MRKEIRINREKAEEYFVSIVSMPPIEERKEKGVLHHVDTTLKEKDLKRYNEGRIEDLVPMTRNEHAAIHHKGGVSPMKGKHQSEKQKAAVKAANKGRKLSEETRKKISEAKTGVKLSDEHKQRLKDAFENRGKHWKVVDGKRVWY